MTDTLPSGEVTLLFTDVEGSTRLWELHAERMLPLLADHDEILGAAVRSAGGVLQTSRAEGDSGFAVFADPRAALTAAITLQRDMAAHDWPGDLRIRTRAAVHTGTVELRGGTYYGPVVNRCVKLRALAHGGQVILSKATADAVGDGLPEGATLEDLGTHRLKELAVPERVYELRHPEMATGFPPLRSPDVERHNLPDLQGRFVGRAEEKVAVIKALDVERLVSLVGTGGVGKTRLAVEVGWARVEGSDAGAHGGTWFADLTGARSEHDVDGILATAVGAREQPGRPLLETVTDALGESAALVVLDNCEHVVPAARRLVQGVLDRCPNTRILATSREALGLDGEMRRAVPGLPLAEAADLFLDRAGLDATALDDATREAIERLCERLDGIPFAIEIAAARAESIGPEAVEAGVAQAQVEEAGRTVLEATLAWSHGLLEPDEQVLFRRLGIFAGRFTLDGAEAVTAFDPLEPFDVLDLVSALVDRSLIHRGESGAYRQLVVAREYASRLAAQAGERDTLARRHLEWALALALQSWRGQNEHERSDPLRQVGDDLLAALDRRFEDDDLAALQVQLAGALEPFWFARGAYSEGLSRLESLLTDGRGFRSNRAEVHRGAARLSTWLGDLAGAARHLDASHELIEEVLQELRAADSEYVEHFEAQLVATLLRKAEVCRLTGDLRAAVALAKNAHALAADAQAPYCLLEIGLAESRAGETEAATAHLLDALDAARRTGDEALVADCLRNLGSVVSVVADWEAAERYLRSALALDRDSGVEGFVAQSLVNLAEVLCLAGRDATSELDEVLALSRTLGNRVVEAHALSLLAEQIAHRDASAAAELHHGALELFSAAGMPREVAATQIRVASYAELRGSLAEAVGAARSAVDELIRLGDDRGAVEGLAVIIRLESRHGSTAAASAALRQAIDRATQARATLQRPELLEAAAWVALALGRREQAKTLLAAAAEERSDLGLVATVPVLEARAAIEAELDGYQPAPTDPEAILQGLVETV